MVNFSEPQLKVLKPHYYCSCFLLGTKALSLGSVIFLLLRERESWKKREARTTRRIGCCGWWNISRSPVGLLALLHLHLHFNYGGSVCICWRIGGTFLYLCNKGEYFLNPKNLQEIKDWIAEMQDAFSRIECNMLSQVFKGKMCFSECW